MNPETSLIRSTPYPIPLIIRSDFLVSKERQIFLFFFLNDLITSCTLFHSVIMSILFDPGLVDSPPTSIILAPELIIFDICLRALFFLLNFPPSEKLSGVKFKIPIIVGLEKFTFFKKFFLFVTIFFKSFFT